MAKQSDIDLYIREVKAAHLAEIEKAKAATSWFLSGEDKDTLDEFPAVNLFLGEVGAAGDLPDKLALKYRQQILATIRLMVQKDFDFINLEHLLIFMRVAVEKNLLKSFVFENLVLNTLFHLLERNLGHKQFDTAAFLGALIQIVEVLGQRRNTFALNNKVVVRFARLLQKNFYFFLESNAVVERLANFLVDSFLESVRSFGRMAGAERSGQFTQTCLNDDCNFLGVASRILKPGVVAKFDEHDKFLAKIKTFVDLFSSISAKIGDSGLLTTEFFGDCFGVFNLVYGTPYFSQRLPADALSDSFKVLAELSKMALKSKKIEFFGSFLSKNLVLLCLRSLQVEGDASEYLASLQTLVVEAKKAGVDAPPVLTESIALLSGPN